MGERKMTDKKFPLFTRIEIQIINLFYSNSNWKYNSYTIKEIANEIGATRFSITRCLKRLEDLGILKSISSKPKVWEPVNDDDLRKRLEEEIFSQIRTLFPKKRKKVKKNVK
jgi:DNA-binding Lrp family transcriptional regulator